MNSRHLAGWALAASVIVGVSVGVYPSLPVLAQSGVLQEADRLNQL